MFQSPKKLLLIVSDSIRFLEGFLGVDCGVHYRHGHPVFRESFSETLDIRFMSRDDVTHGKLRGTKRHGYDEILVYAIQDHSRQNYWAWDRCWQDLYGFLGGLNVKFISEAEAILAVRRALPEASPARPYPPLELPTSSTREKCEHVYRQHIFHIILERRIEARKRIAA